MSVRGALLSPERKIERLSLNSRPSVRFSLGTLIDEDKCSNESNTTARSKNLEEWQVINLVRKTRNLKALTKQMHHLYDLYTIVKKSMSKKERIFFKKSYDVIKEYHEYILKLYANNPNDNTDNTESSHNTYEYNNTFELIKHFTDTTIEELTPLLEGIENGEDELDKLKQNRLERGIIKKELSQLDEKVGYLCVVYNNVKGNIKEEYEVSFRKYYREYYKAIRKKLQNIQTKLDDEQNNDTFDSQSYKDICKDMKKDIDKETRRLTSLLD